MEFETEDQHAKRIGAKRRFHWRERRTHIKGPPATKEVIAVIRTPYWEMPSISRHERREKITPWHYAMWWLDDRLYHEKWVLECGHIARPVIRYDAYGKTGSDRYFKPDEYPVLCHECSKLSEEVIVERYKEYYWDYHTAENPHKSQKCHECGMCYICGTSHKKGCLQEFRDWLFEMIWDILSLKSYSDPDLEEDRDKIRELIQDLLGAMDKKSLREVGSWYAD